MTAEATGTRRSVLGRALDMAYLAAGWLAGLFLIAIFLLMLSLSLGRQVGLNIPAGDEFVAWSMAAAAFLGLAHTFKSGEMIRVGLLIDQLRGRTRQAVEIIGLAIGLAFTSYFAWHAINFTYYSWLTNDMAQGVLPIKLWIPQLAYCAGLTLLAVAFLEELILASMGRKPSYWRDPPKTAEEAIERAAASAI